MSLFFVFIFVVGEGGGGGGLKQAKGHLQAAQVRGFEV